MEYLYLECVKHETLVNNLQDLTGATPEKTELLLNVLKDILPNTPQESEYFFEESEETVTPDVLGFFIPETRYYISIKSSTLHIAMWIMDYFFAGIPSKMDSLTGFMKKAIWKITDRHYCVFSEILRLHKCSSSQLEQLFEERHECCNHSEIWKCPFLSEEKCLLSSTETKKIVDELAEDDLILKNNEIIHYNW